MMIMYRHINHFEYHIDVYKRQVYGDPIVHPQEESYWGNVNPIGLRSCYDAVSYTHLPESGQGELGIVKIIPYLCPSKREHKV